MQDAHIYEHRIRRLIDAVYAKRYSRNTPLAASYIYDQDAPIPYARVRRARFKPIRVGQQWGKLWGSAWFRFEGRVPAACRGREVVALLDIGAEGCVFVDGEPLLGLTDKPANKPYAGKRLVPLFKKAAGGERVAILVEAGANQLFGANAGRQFALKCAELVCPDRRVWRLEMDLRTLQSLMEAQEPNTPRRNKLLYGLNEVANRWDDGRGVDTCLTVTRELLAQPAQASASTAYSIGHAHLDLGWLWPVRETKRKGARTFSTALQLMKEYPEYKFGASQAQLYEWIRQNHPGLYKRVQKAVKARRWECQGAMWAEPDMNIAGGEALVRQCLYGKALFRKDFGVDVTNLWLPDVFGYSAALPQILKKCGVDYFMTQKISWNETNTFPHHTFYWEGIDGTRILTHFLPTNTYNADNMPRALAAADKRFAQNDVSSEFLNLYGIGDGGGGPSRIHVEIGLRQQNLEGAPRFKFSFAEDFFRKIARIPAEKLPVWVGELYLELHRGTYTTQGLMKRYNRQLELRLRDVEFLCALAGLRPKAELDRIWQDTLLHQFHDILPGSSIGWVYRDAHAVSQRHLAALESIRDRALARLHGAPAGGRGSHAVYVVYNTLSWDRTETVRIPAGRGARAVTGAHGATLPAHRCGDELECRVCVPAMGYTTLTLGQTAPNGSDLAPLKASRSVLENAFIRVRLGADGTIVSLFDKQAGRETLAGPANELLLWEDDPRAWDAWDISHYYRETAPAKAKRTAVELEHRSPFSACIKQTLKVGRSVIEQRIGITAGSKCVLIRNTVDWHEAHRMLRVSARPAVQSAEASFEIQYGTLRRPTHANTSWDRARFEVCAHRFVDLSQPDHGFALINDCKYGHYVRGNTLDLTLLRSPKKPDPDADIGRHTFTFGYLPHQGTLVESDVLRVAHALNSPLLVAPAGRAPAQRAKSFYRLEGEHVKIEAVKPAEDGKGIVLRLYETAGSTARVRLHAADGWNRLQETDLLEKPIGKPAGAGRSKTLTFKPFEIRTFVLT
ncbi:MAG: alpha-mannosidase [Kiritimatiellae bacterium]|nr:alpha-mannosidase [Kiritimatiellia bacterium]